MDIKGLTEALVLGKGALDIVKGVVDLLPGSPKRKLAEETLQMAEKAFQIAEAEAARSLGYIVCRCTWPPTIGLSTGPNPDDPHSEIFKCDKCGRVYDDEDLPTLELDG
ncbi:MAG: hypothetical protein V2A74_13850 [bacterium]